MALELKHSTLVEQQLPAYVREEGPKFVTFLKKYFEFLEQSGKPVYEIRNFLKNTDLDTAPDSLLLYFKDEFLSKFPDNMVADKINIMKNVIDFYRAKGTEDSYKFFFRAVYDQSVDIYYPSSDILRASDGRWANEKTIRTTSPANIFDSLGYEINGSVLSGKAIVDKVEQFQSAASIVSEIFLVDVEGNFAPNETVTTTNGVTAQVYGLVESVTITTPGTGYTVGEQAVVSGGGGGDAIVTVATVGGSGEILTTLIQNVGTGFVTTPTISFTFIGNGDAVGYITMGAIKTYEGRWLTNDGKLSWDKYLQDNFFYQAYSYVLRVDQSIDKYRDLVKELIHPAGMKVFGEVSTEGIIIAPLDISVDSVTFSPSENVIVAPATIDSTETAVTLSWLRPFVNPLCQTYGIFSDIAVYGDDLISSQGDTVISTLTGSRNNCFLNPYDYVWPITLADISTTELDDIWWVQLSQLDSQGFQTDVLYSYINQTGTVSMSAGTKSIVGVGTLFSTEYGIDDLIEIGNELHKVATISDNLNMTVYLDAIGTYSGVILKRRTAESGSPFPIDENFVLGTSLLGTATL